MTPVVRISTVKRLTILIVLGTRPEAIKLAALIRLLKGDMRQFECLLCSSGQHREMLQQVFDEFHIAPDFDLAVMAPHQTLEGTVALILQRIGSLLQKIKPDWVIVQGDTITAMAVSICAFFHRIRVAHVEAGLRSENIDLPFPEEFNRRVVSLASSLHFCPTVASRKNLLREGIDPAKIVITGNTVIDALLWMANELTSRPVKLPDRIEETIRSGRRIILVTGHRRESFGKPFEQMCLALRDIAERYRDCVLVYPVHLNPNVQSPVRAILSGVPGIVLTDPLSYRPFVRLMNSSYLVLTDSGGIQEEAPSLGKPVLVLREVTERPEGVQAGVARVIGTERSAIVEGVKSVLENHALYRRMSSGANPYGDGRASQRIVETLAKFSHRPLPSATPVELEQYS
jgi:UDP-N-acetylglucosamine 2-epimerase